MIDFPCAKINLGLNIVEKRNDGYHNLQTVFLPVQLCDALEIKTMSERFPSDTNCDLKVSGDGICCNEADNLVVKAYNMLAADYEIPRIHAHLYKRIPSQAGLGGGSSDAAFMLKLLDQRFRINAGNAELEKYAARLGADCPFFINAEPAYAEGIGEILSPVEITDNTLSGLHSRHCQATGVRINQGGFCRYYSTHARSVVPRDSSHAYRTMEGSADQRF